MSIFKDKILLITGGTGSFGNAVLDRFLTSDIKEIRIATDEYQIINAVRKREDSSCFKEVLSKCSYFWGEIDEKLFDHNPPQYKLEKQKNV